MRGQQWTGVPPWSVSVSETEPGKGIRSGTSHNRQVGGHLGWAGERGCKSDKETGGDPTAVPRPLWVYTCIRTQQTTHITHAALAMWSQMGTRTTRPQSCHLECGVIPQVPLTPTIAPGWGESLTVRSSQPINPGTHAPAPYRNRR